MRISWLQTGLSGIVSASAPARTSTVSSLLIAVSTPLATRLPVERDDRASETSIEQWRKVPKLTYTIWTIDSRLLNDV
jgi:hypothetical protein